jgi:DNA polymerase (family X)
MENREVARVLRETAQLLEIDGAIIGRYRSYEKAAELIASLAESIEALAGDPEKLEELPGIGERMAEHIREILSTGDYGLRKKLLKKYPLTMLDLLSLQSLGPKKALILWREFHCCTVEQLEKLAREGRLRDLAGFGEKTEQNILKAIEVFKKIGGRFVIPTAEHEADKLVAYIKRYGKAIASITPAGSLRRWKETIGDLDFLLTIAPRTKPEELEAIKEHILGYGELEQVLARGENKVSFRVAKGLQVDVRLLQPESYGAALIYFTGSKEHNVSLRGRAIKMGYTLNEYALATLKEERRVAGATEEEVYAKLKLDFIPPELRENCGEIEAAEKRSLPQLITQKDLQGDVHMHTVETDGRNTIEEMAEAAKERGYKYMAITDHSKNLAFANGLDDKRAVEHIARIREAAKKIDGITIFAGIEVDILADGDLDLSNDVLAQMDIVIASVHSVFNQESAKMTERLIKAIENPNTSLIGHPTGRILLRRDSYGFDVHAVLTAAAKHKVAMELNSYPDRLDLNDAHLRQAKQHGVKIVINTDSHHISHMDKIRFGVLQARRAWLTKDNVLNTLPPSKFAKAMKHEW